jgi:predicted MFS family arabinose efflux permease
VVAAAVIGNALEFYDFAVYAAYAVYIGRAFFPTDNHYTSLLLSVATFGVGFFTRPLGGLVIGAYADRYGRKPALTLTITIMALSCGAIGVLPTYATIGIAAPILLVLARMLQGFSTGGEMGPATTYLLETAPRARRSFFGSWQASSQSMSALAAGVVGVTLGSLLSPASLQGWGWRIPFLLGLAILPVGLYIRAGLNETLDFGQAHHSMGGVLSDMLARHKGTVLLAILVISGGTITQYFFNYMPTYGLTVLHLPPAAALAASFAYGVTGSIAAVAGGLVADRFNRWGVMILPRLLLIALVWPVLLMMNAYPSPAVFLGIVGAFMTLHSFSLGVTIVMIPACFPAAIRTTGLSVGYAFGVAIFGGTAQVVFTWLIGSTGNPMSPAFYLIAANLVTVAATWAMRGRERIYRET